MASRGGGALKGWGSGERAWEVRWGEVKPFPRSVGAEGGRRRGLRVEAVGGGNHGATASSLAQGKTRLGSGERERSGEGSSTSAARAKGEETGEGGGEARSAVAARRRRGASTSILGVRAGDGGAWRFEKLQEGTRGAERAGARRGSGAWPTARRRTPSRREQRREMEVMA